MLLIKKHYFFSLFLYINIIFNIITMTEQEINLCEYNDKKCCHCKNHLRYHIIFVTKYRRKCLNEIRQSVFDAFKYVESKSHMKIYNMNIDQDHIHLLISFPPDYSISQTINRLKQMTTNYLYRIKNVEIWLKKFYWKKKRVIWTHGYFISTIGHISEQTVFKYIENQGKSYYIN